MRGYLHGTSWGNEWRQSGPKSPVMHLLLHSVLMYKMDSMILHITRSYMWGYGCLCVLTGARCVMWPLGWDPVSEHYRMGLWWEFSDVRGHKDEEVRGRKRNNHSWSEGSRGSSNTVSRKCWWGFSIFCGFQLVGEKNHVRYSGTAGMNLMCMWFFFHSAHRDPIHSMLRHWTGFL